MTDIEQNNKRIARNTLLLYVRMLFIMAISLYTSRVVLNILGIEDYGIYNVVGGVVSMFGFLNTAMTSTTQRYITFYLGKGNISDLKNIFSNCLLTHAIICVIVVVLAETVGLWFLYNKMVIPEDRLTAALIVFQCSIIATIVMIMSVPYNADIVAHEKMSAFAYISILEVTLKLVIVYLLVFVSYDKLILYAFLLLIVQILIRLIYGNYCKRHFVESIFRLNWNKNIFFEMLSFAGWNLWGGMSSVLYTQGLNILLNIFFGPIINAARGIAVQVQSAVIQFSQSFQMAINPQITKCYAKGKLTDMHNLIYWSSKITFILLFAISLPIIIETDFILKIWLKVYPEYTITFIRLILCIVIVDAVANPLMISVAATGKVKFYQSVIGGTMLLILPTSYIWLKFFGGNPYSVFFVHLTYCILTFVIRLFIVRPLIRLKISSYVNKVVVRCLSVSVTSVIFVLLIKLLFAETFTPSTTSVIIVILSPVFSLALSFVLCLTINEKIVVINKIKILKQKFVINFIDKRISS